MLQFIQQHQVIRVGGERVIDVDVRLICAGNQPLDQLVKENKFREDLYYRLNVYPVNLPALRARQEDIIPLAETFLVKFARELDRPARRFSAAALEQLKAYSWPGNVRELENVIQRAVVLAADEFISAEHLPEDFHPASASATSGTVLPFAQDATLAQVEQFWIQHMLEQCHGNKSEAALKLGIDPSTLFRKLK